MTAQPKPGQHAGPSRPNSSPGLHTASHEVGRTGASTRSHPTAVLENLCSHFKYDRTPKQENKHQPTIDDNCCCDDGKTMDEQSQRRLTIRIIIVMTDDESKRSRMRETSKPIFGNTSLSHASPYFGSKMQ